MLQEPPAATLVPQEFVWEKGPDETATPLIFSVVLPTLVSVAVLDVTQEQMMRWGIQ
jgi:hypothetical protein